VVNFLAHKVTVKHQTNC